MEMMCEQRMELMKDRLKVMMKGHLMVLQWMEKTRDSLTVMMLGLPMILLSMDWMTGQLMEMSWEQRMELMKG